MVNRVPDDLRQKIALTANEAWKLNEALEVAIVHPPRVERTATSSRAVEAPIPWNDWAANLITELHASARRRELTLLELVTVNLAERVRGGSNGNTRRALQHLTRLVELATDDEALEVLRWLDHRSEERRVGKECRSRW